ncbi:MAG: class I tRNA ligase family protein, partial [Enterobacteriaceae bacterium]
GQRGAVAPLQRDNLQEAQGVLRRELHKTIAKVTDDIGRRQTFNTAIAAIMELLNKITRAEQESEQDRALLQEALIAIVKMLYPFIPHTCFVMWQQLVAIDPLLQQNPISIDEASWPVADAEAMVEESKLVVVQVNGKIRAKITVAADASQEQVEALAKEQPGVAKYLEGQSIRKVIYVAGKLLNLVAN